MTVLPSTSVVNGERRSRIVPMFPEGSAVTVTRGYADIFVTEYGIARIKGGTLRRRIEELVGIAHPDFRAELRADARRLYGVEKFVVCSWQFVVPSRKLLALCHQDAVAEVQLLDIEQIRVPAMPGAAADVRLQTRERGLHDGRISERQSRDGCADARIQIRLGTAPVRAKHSVGTVMRDGQRQGPDVPELTRDSPTSDDLNRVFYG